jgi:hypothetical protein
MAGGRCLADGHPHALFLISATGTGGKAPEGYRHFDAGDPGWTKVVLTPVA